MPTKFHDVIFGKIRYNEAGKIEMTMQDWEEKPNGFLTLWNHEILQDAGKVSAELAAAAASSADNERRRHKSGHRQGTHRQE